MGWYVDAITGNRIETVVVDVADEVERGPKDIAGKIDWSVMPFTELSHVAKVFEYGAKKYGQAFTYRKIVPANELFAAIIRHAICIQNGQDIDEESGCYHAAHVAANALMILSNKGDA